MARLTMRDIARAAGVSTSTVSRALNGSALIPAATRERIAAIARDHNYRVDLQAQNFRLQRAGTVAVLFPYDGTSQRLISDPFYMEIAGAISDALSERDTDMLLARVPIFDDEWCLRYALDRRADGIILIDRALQDRGVARLQELGAPVVVWGARIDGQEALSVGGDSFDGARQAVAHLIARGRRRIGCIGGFGSMVETDARKRGYRAALLTVGIAPDESLIIDTDFTPRAASAAVETLLRRAPDLDGLFACSDFMAVAAMEALRAAGRRVPTDVAVVGYDDVPLASYCSPRLTTIRQPIHAGGALLVQMLFALLDGAAAESVVLPVELVARDSS
jgi:DNA-binding LacI/PurR family transcriptional regulator